jgi:hypothetical protein
MSLLASLQSPSRIEYAPPRAGRRYSGRVFAYSPGGSLSHLTYGNPVVGTACLGAGTRHRMPRGVAVAALARDKVTGKSERARCRRRPWHGWRPLVRSQCVAFRLDIPTALSRFVNLRLRGGMGEGWTTVRALAAAWPMRAWTATTATLFTKNSLLSSRVVLRESRRYYLTA